MEVIRAFSVPFIKFKFTKHNNYNFSDTPKQVKLPKGWTVPLNSSFPNIKDDDKIVTKNVRDNLIDDLTDDIKQHFNELNILTNFKMSSFWYNIYHDFQGQEPHDHLTDCSKQNPFWSGIYYYRSNTATKFDRSDMMCRTQEFPEWMNTKISDCFQASFTPDVTSGDILLWPPYLKHGIFTGPKKEMRMTFAFNLIIT